MDRKKIEEAQRKLEWAIESLDLSIKCMVISYKDERYKAQFFTREDKLITAAGFSISEEWIKNTLPIEGDIGDELKSLLINLEREAKEIRDLKNNVAKKNETD